MIEIGTVRNLRVQVVTVTDIGSGAKATGIKIEPVPAAEASVVGRPMALLDPEEVDALIKSVEYLKSEVYINLPDNYTDAFYTTTDGFTAGVIFADKQWRGVIKLNKFESNTPYYLRMPDDFNVLLELLRQAKAKIK